MKNARLGMVTAVLSFIVYSDSASAQGSVTLYGVIDAGINYLNNVQTGRSGGSLQGGRQISLQDGTTGGIRGSRWGLRGKEALGNGYEALFVLENGFSISNGTLSQGGAEFGRQAYVGIKAPYGTVTLGRQYDPIVDVVQGFTSGASWAGYMGSHAGDVDNEINTRRINNALKFASADYYGLRFEGLYSFGGVPGSVASKQVWSLAGGYTSGPFAMGVGYLNARSPNLGFYGANPNAGTTAATNNVGSLGSVSTPEVNPIYAGYASASTTQIIGAAASYTLGAATLGLLYSNVQFRGLGSSSGPNPLNFRGMARFDNGEANIKYQITPALLAGAAYVYTRGTGANNAGAAIYHQLQSGIDYFLSKRTDVYSIVVYQHAAGTDSFGQPSVAYITGQTASASNHQLAVRLGITHRF